MNVFVIIADSLRKDHVGCYGNDWIKTPNFDKFAGESAKFTEAYPEGLPTGPARAAMWTGKYTLPFHSWKNFTDDDVLLPELLWDKGYEKAMITDVYHMHRPKRNWGRGYQYTHFIRGQEEDPYLIDPDIEVDMDSVWVDDGKGPDGHNFRQTYQYLKNTAHWKGSEDTFVAQTVKEGVNWIEKTGKKDNLFLWLDCFDPHEPWDPPEEFHTYNPGYKGKKVMNPTPGLVEGYLTPEELQETRALYAGEVSLVDHWIGHFLDYLKDNGFYDNSLIMITSDHGEPLGEHGVLRKCRSWSHFELSEIPWLIRHPEGIGAGKSIDAFVQLSDLTPTVLDYLGMERPDYMHGLSLLPLMSGEKEKLRDFAISGWYNRNWSSRNHEWSYHYYLPTSPHEIQLARSGNRTTPELFNRKTDPQEQVNVIDEHEDIGNAMEVELRTFMESLVRGTFES
ncbi:sulfatase [Candidatus Hydrogenedentota bacterium]